MADEETKTEETKAKDDQTEETKSEETKSEETKTEETKDDEALRVATEAQEKFDKQIDDDGDDSVVDDEEDPDKKSDESDDEKKAEEDDPGKTDDSRTDEDKLIDEEAEAIEKQIDADAAKTDEQRATEKVEADKKVAEAAEAAKATEDKPFDCGLKIEGDDAYEPELVKAVNVMGQQFTDKNKALASENADLRDELRVQSNIRHAEWLDRKIEALGEDFHETLGEGEHVDLDPAGKQLENRVAISKRMATVAQVYVNRKQSIPSRNKLFKGAVSYLHEKIVNKSKTEAKTVKGLKARAGQAIGRAGKKASALSAEQKCANAQKDFDKIVEAAD